jgi:DNA-binding NarL/FixJ family response regulator
MPLRVLLADDAPSVREGVKALLERDGFEVVGEATNGREAIQLAQAHHPDVAVLDLEMPQMNGLDAAQEILQVCPGTQTILLTIHREEHQILMALRSGIRGYLVKTHAPEELGRAIREVAGGGVFLSSSILRLVVQAYLANIEPPRS